MYYNFKDCDYNVESLLREYSDYVRERNFKAMNENSIKMPSDENNRPMWPVDDYFQGKRDFSRDEELMINLYSDLNSSLYPIVHEVISEFELTKSPIFDDYINRETIAQLVDRSINRARVVLNPVDEIMTSDISEYPIYIGMNRYWHPRFLLRAMVESLVINEIFRIRRPGFQRLQNLYRY